MKPSPFLLVLAAAAVGGTSSVQAILLTNGNLDRTTANEITPGFFLPKPSNWVNQGSRAITGPYEDEMSSEPWAGPAPTPVTTDGNLNPPPPDGFGGADGGVFFKAFSGTTASGAATAHLYQDNPATPGLMYQLTGWAGAEANYLATQSLFALDFLNAANAIIGSSETNLVVAGLFTPNGQSFNYKQYSVTGIAPANTTTVRARISMIGGTGNPIGGGQAFVVDDFALNVVPEPGTAMFCLTSLAGLVSLRSRKRASR